MGSLSVIVEGLTSLESTKYQIKMKLLLLASILTFGQLVSSNAPIQPLVGRWVEDERLRTGLNDFLWARGVNWFKRQYAVSLTTWQYEQTIIWRGNGYQVSGIKGPLKEVFNYKLTPDNRTVTQIDLGSALGGLRDTTAEFTGNALVSYCKDPATGKVDMIATRSIPPNNPDVMLFKTYD